MSGKERKILKLAIIGGSVDSAVGYTHLIAAQLDHRWEIVSACFSSKIENSLKTVNAWNLKNIRLYDDWQSLLLEEKGKIDAVAILTPTTLHYKMVKKALDLSIPIICEKALSTSYDEVREICDIQKKNNGFIAVTYNYTGYPMLRELASRKDLGKITQIQIEMPQEGFSRLNIDNTKPQPQAWRLQDGGIPSISLDLGTHLQHMIYFISGEHPKSLVAIQNSFGFFEGLVDDVSIIAMYPSGMKSVSWFGKTALGQRNGLRVRVYGTKGSAEWYQMEPELLTVYDIYGTKKILDRAGDVNYANALRYQRFKTGHPAGFIEAFANLYVDIADKLETYLTSNNYDPNWVYGSKQSARIMYVLERVNQSNKESAWVEL